MPSPPVDEGRLELGVVVGSGVSVVLVVGRLLVVGMGDGFCDAGEVVGMGDGFCDEGEITVGVGGRLSDDEDWGLHRLLLDCLLCRGRVSSGMAGATRAASALWRAMW